LNFDKIKKTKAENVVFCIDIAIGLESLTVIVAAANGG
jgi:hypothetical protein